MRDPNIDFGYEDRFERERSTRALGLAIICGAYFFAGGLFGAFLGWIAWS